MANRQDASKVKNRMAFMKGSPFHCLRAFRFRPSWSRTRAAIGPRKLLNHENTNVGECGRRSSATAKNLRKTPDKTRLAACTSSQGRTSVLVAEALFAHVLQSGVQAVVILITERDEAERISAGTDLRR